MTTALEQFRNNLINPQNVEVSPRLITGAATQFGQSDLQGNVAYFNNLQSPIVGIDQAFEVPIGAGTIAGNITLLTTGSPTIIPMITQFPAQARIQFVGGQFVCPIPGSYALNVNYTVSGLTVTTSPNYILIASLRDYQNNLIVQDAQAVPAANTTWWASYNTLFYVAPSLITANQNMFGFALALQSISAGVCSAIDCQVDYVGNFSGNVAFHPNVSGEGIAILTGPD